jgi:hypothetical protein
MTFVIADQSTFDNAFKALSTLGAFGTFLWTVYTWRQKTKQELEASAADTERASRARIIEATKPFLQYQLDLYTKVARAASFIATSNNERDLDSAIESFMALSSGELVLVENDEVAAAINDFRAEVTRLRPLAAMPNSDGPEKLPVNAPDHDRDQLQQLARNLARACRKSLAKSWHVDAWANPDQAA